jgi:predicted LPLAT superfamily acyltransferase
MTRHWSSIGEAGAVNGMRFMVWTHSVLGRRVFDLFLIPAMVYYFLRRGEARRASQDFLRRVRAYTPDSLNDRPIFWLSFRHFLSFGGSLLDKYLAWVKTPDSIAMDSDQERRLFELVDSGVGCLVIGSHFGNLEYSRGIAHRHPHLVINVLTYDQHAVKFAELMKQSEPESRLNLIQVTDLDIQLALRLKEKLRAGEWLVIAGDRVPVGDNERVCLASFFGRAARFPIGPYVLANLMGCPVYLFHCFLVAGEYRLVLEHFSDGIQLSRKNRQDDLEQLTQRYASSLERQVARSPLQWFNFYDFWAGSTEGDSAV